MKVTYDWLQQYTEMQFKPEDLVEKLTMLGLEVDSVEYASWDFDGIVVGEVLTKEVHQKSDKLWICKVDIGSRNLEVVCGAPNVEVGQLVPVATDGTRLPSGTVIQRTQIRGVESEGMICSEAELGISSRAEGIMVLDESAKKGARLNEVLGKGEIIFDIDVTPNRPDCFGAIGIAREIACISNATLKKPEIALKESEAFVENFIKISILNPEYCPRYTARFIGEVTIKPSPWWLTEKLEAVGIRSINNVVDVTNFVMMETGQPLHAFDYDLLEECEIVVKSAQAGQKFTTLDDKVHTLNEECLMICDGKKEIALGGIMGGLNSEVSESTTNILLESAYFQPVNIRRTAKKLGISTESSRRFERGTDPEGVVYALNRAVQLIAELSGGKIARNYVDVYPEKIPTVKLNLRISRVEKLLGVAVPHAMIKDILQKLEFKVQDLNPDEIEVVAPTFRPDIRREADLIEEVARVYGFENIPPDTSAHIDQKMVKNVAEQNHRQIQNILISLGFSETVTYSLVNGNDAAMFADTASDTRLFNPISEDLSTLRTSLLPGLLTAIRWNLNRKNKDLKLFEIGTVFQGKEGKYQETTRVAGVMTGKVVRDSWKNKSLVADAYDVKGVAACLMERLHRRNYKFTAHKSSYTTPKALALEMDGQALGVLGEVHQDVLEKFEIETPVYFFDLDFTALVQKTDFRVIFSPIPKFPPVTRDLAITVKDTLDAEAIAQEIQKNGGAFLQNVELFDVFKGRQIEANHKSIAFNLTFYSLEKTLTENEIDSQMQRILAALENKFSAKLRN
ncbi:MAG: phenylalanine--tRNA ligase subunit beta [bacterium]